MKTIIRKLLVFFVIPLSLNAQTLSLDECLDKGMNNFPLNKQFRYIEESTSLKLKSLNTNYYPHLDLTGQVTWQNDVPHVSLENAPFQIPYAPKDQYKSYIDVRQVIYDGGMTKAAKKVERIKGEAESVKVKTDLYGIRSGIINSYFLILLLDEQIKQIEYSIDNLEKRNEEVTVMINNGVLLPSNGDALKVEILKLKQNIISLEEARYAAFEVLSEYMGDTITDSVKLNPAEVQITNTEIQRPEIQLFDLQRQQLSASSQLMGKKRLPTLSGFGQLGYGNPGFNMLLDSFEPFYMVGVRLSWNIWDWKSTSNERKILQNQSSNVEAQEEAFIKNIGIGTSQISSKIRTMEKMLESDQEIIDLRKKITKESETQLKNGVITSSDYISELNKESIAQISLKYHQIELAKARAELANLLGKEL